MSEKFSVVCECGQKINVPLEMDGQRGVCPTCRQQGTASFTDGKFWLVVERDDSPDTNADRSQKLGWFEELASEIKKKQEESSSSLTDCRDCGGQIAKSAESCPHCGSSVPTGAAAFAAIVQGIAAIVALYFFGKLFLFWLCAADAADRLRDSLP